MSQPSESGNHSVRMILRLLIVIIAMVALSASASVNGADKRTNQTSWTNTSSNDTQIHTSELTTTAPNDTQTIPSESTTIPANNTQNQTTEPTTTAPNDTQTIPSESTTIPANNTQNQTSKPTTTAPNDTQTIPSESTTIPTNNTQNQTTEPTTTASNDTQTIPSESTTIPTNNTQNQTSKPTTTTPNDTQTIPSESTTISANNTQNQTSKPTTTTPNDTQTIPSESTTVSANNTQNQTTEPITTASNDTQEIPSESTTVSSNKTQQVISDLNTQLQKLSNDTHLLIADVRKNLTQIDESEQQAFDRTLRNNIKLRENVASALANVTNIRSKHTRLQQRYEALVRSYGILRRNYDTVQQKIENNTNILRDINDKSASIERNINQKLMIVNEDLQIIDGMKTNIVEISKDIPLFNVTFMNSLNDVEDILDKNVAGTAGVARRRMQLLVDLGLQNGAETSLKLRDLRNSFSLACPKNWDLIDSTCYKLPTSPKRISANMATLRCEQENGALATIRSDTVEDYIQRKKSFNWVWVGGRYNMPSQTGPLWTWQDGTPIIDGNKFTSWGYDNPYPSISDDKERDCMYDRFGVWFHDACENIRRSTYACEKPSTVMLL